MIDGYYHLNAVFGRGFVKGTMSAHLHVVHTKHVARSRKNTKVEEATSSTWMDHVDHISDVGQQTVIKRRTRAAQKSSQESRNVRVEELRAQVRAGTYRVDSMSLAQRMLANESHFLETTQ